MRLYIAVIPTNALLFIDIFYMLTIYRDVSKIYTDRHNINTFVVYIKKNLHWVVLVHFYI